MNFTSSSFLKVLSVAMILWYVLSLCNREVVSFFHALSHASNGLHQVESHHHSVTDHSHDHIHNEQHIDHHHHYFITWAGAFFNGMTDQQHVPIVVKGFNADKFMEHNLILKLDPAISYLPDNIFYYIEKPYKVYPDIPSPIPDLDC